MLGSLDPEERVMSDIPPHDWTKNKDEFFAWDDDGIMDRVQDIIETLDWKEEDDIVVEIGGTVVSGIHQGENYNKKWATPYGVRKYNKDAFIIISNNTRRDLTKSQPLDREHKPHHPFTPVKPQDIVVNMDGGVGGSWEVKEES